MIEIPLGLKVKIPSPKTLDKYGLNEQQWLAILQSQSWLCPICQKFSNTGLWVTDHFHVKNFKKMKPDMKRIYVRGVTHWYCNKTFIGRGITIAIAENIVKYLEKFESRKNAGRPIVE